VAVSHLAVGTVLFRDVLVTLARAGVVGSVPLRGDRSTAFWFLLASPGWWAAGRELRAAERRDDRPAQRRVGSAVAGIGAVGAALLPRSPFWLLAALGLAAVRSGSAGPRPVRSGAA
jgi:hypothetical protein